VVQASLRDDCLEVGTHSVTTQITLHGDAGAESGINSPCPRQLNLIFVAVANKGDKLGQRTGMEVRRNSWQLRVDS